MMQIQHAIEPQRPCRTSSPHWAYQQNGLLLIRSVFSPEEIDIFQREAHRMVDQAFQTSV